MREAQPIAAHLQDACVHRRRERFLPVRYHRCDERNLRMPEGGDGDKGGGGPSGEARQGDLEPALAVSWNERIGR